MPDDSKFGGRRKMVYAIIEVTAGNATTVVVTGPIVLPRDSRELGEWVIEYTRLESDWSIEERDTYGRLTSAVLRVFEVDSAHMPETSRSWSPSEALDQVKEAFRDSLNLKARQLPVSI
jgi:hypothetical protein